MPSHGGLVFDVRQDNRVAGRDATVTSGAGEAHKKGSGFRVRGSGGHRPRLSAVGCLAVRAVQSSQFAVYSLPNCNFRVPPSAIRNQHSAIRNRKAAACQLPTGLQGSGFGVRRGRRAHLSPADFSGVRVRRFVSTPLCSRTCGGNMRKPRWRIGGPSRALRALQRASVDDGVL
jgi:hypothetical protein